MVLKINIKIGEKKTSVFETDITNEKIDFGVKTKIEKYIYTSVQNRNLSMKIKYQY